MAKIRHILADDPTQVPVAQNDHVIEAFTPDAANETLTSRVGFRCLPRRPQHLDPPVLSHTSSTSLLNSLLKQG